MLDSQSTQHNLGLPSDCFDLFEAGRQSVSTIPALKRHCQFAGEFLEPSSQHRLSSGQVVQCCFLRV